jgi:hypothetical protein
MMQSNQSGTALGQLLSSAAEDVGCVLNLIRQPALESLLPDLATLVGCGQGTKTHFEGDVDIHTAMVVANQKRLACLDPRLDLNHVDFLAGLIHDLKKPATRCEHPDGSVTFPGHEERAAGCVPAISDRLGLSGEERDKLFYLVRWHGVAHMLPVLPREEQERLALSQFWRSLRLLQAADASACWLNPEGTQTLPIYWADFEAIHIREGHLH